jgi:hypothetical protein
MNEDLRGVAGWLGFFVVIMAAISPLATVALVARDLYGDPLVRATYADLFGTIELFEWCHAVVVIAGCWFVAWRLVNVQNWLTVKITIGAIWLIAVGGVLTEVGGISLITGIPMEALFGASLGPEMLRPIIFCLIWTAYFLKSERVANTYRAAEEQAEIFE